MACTPAEDLKGITVAVRVRPLNKSELKAGNRVCVHFDDDTGQVALTAVDKNTLLQLKGQAARGYAFDKRYGMDDTSNQIFKDCVEGLVNNVFKGYNGTVLAYGQTGSGKTHTMSGGIGHYGIKEMGLTPQVIDHIFRHVESIKHRLKPGESVEIAASAVEIYNDEFHDLSKGGKGGAGKGPTGWDPKMPTRDLKLQEIPTGQGNRVRAEIYGLHEQLCENANDLLTFFDFCFNQRSTASTNMNATSSRSHALFTITVRRVVVSVGDGVDKNLRAMIRTEGIESKLHLVDLAGTQKQGSSELSADRSWEGAGSERVKRSGAKGATFREATNINSGLLALGNVIVALAERNQHVPYRDSKLTRLVQDSLGGNSLTVLITCISPSEADFEETNNTLKYANRACSILNQPLPNRFLMMEEDLLPVAPGGGGSNVVSIEALLEDNLKQKELRERRNREKEQKEIARREALSVKKEQLMKTKGYQRLLAQEYDRKLKEAKRNGKIRFNVHETVDGQTIEGHTSQSSLMGGERSTPSVSNSGFNYNDFVTETGHSAASGSSFGNSRHAISPEASDTTPSGGKNLSPALARALAKKAKAASQSPARMSLADAPSPGSLVNQSPRTPVSAAVDQQNAHHGRAGPLDEEDLDEEPLAAEVEARVRQEAEREALKQIAMQEGERLPDVDEEAALDEAGDEALDDYDDGEDDQGVRVLARFKVNKLDCVSVFKATTKEDFKDVVKLLPENTPLPASNKMTYLIARLELHPEQAIADRLADVNNRGVPMADAVGPAVGCLMATFGTNMISSCIFDFEDPEDLETFAVEERIELWGLQIPHNSLRPVLKDMEPEAVAAGMQTETEEQSVAWSSVDRLNMSVGLLYALCVNATASDVSCGFCVPRSQLLKRWQGAGVRMKEVTTKMRLIYPPHAHDFEYYKSSTVAFFLVDEVQEGLQKKLALLD